MKKIRNCLVWLIVFALKLITVPFFFFGWIFIAILTFFHWVIDLLSTREDEEFLSEKEVHMRKVDRKNSRRHQGQEQGKGQQQGQQSILHTPSSSHLKLCKGTRLLPAEAGFFSL